MTNDHDTIELRLSRLEDQTTTLIDHNTSHGARIGFAETQVADLARRIERLEAWTRSEIFARTAMDAPDAAKERDHE